MEKHLNIYRNWRVYVLTILSVLAALLILGECEGVTAILLTKGIGFGLAYITYRLGKYWDGKGKIKDLMSLADED